MVAENMHDIVCFKCGAHDMVPFKPRPGSQVQCRTCHEQDRAANPQSGKAAPRWDITCTGCGEADQVPFQPRAGSDVYCRACHQKRGAKRELRRKFSPKRGDAQRTGRSIPRVDHGTRVSYPIDCEKCGKHEILNRVPPANGPVYCSECAEARFGKTWYHVKTEADSQDKDSRPARKPRRWVEDIAKPDKERLKDFEPLTGGVKVRRK